MQTKEGKLKAENKRLIAANAKLLQEVEHWRNLYLVEVNKKLGRQ